MSLADIVVPSEIVPMGAASVTFRALTLNEVATLFKKHAGTVARIVEAFGPALVDATPVQLYTAALAAVGECSDLVADVIATAAGEPHLAAAAAALPIEMQLRALATIFRLTIGAEDPNLILRDLRAAVDAAIVGTRH